MNSKNDRELSIFKQFVEISGLPILLDSITKMPEPAPDIECKNASGERLAFELVELLDEDFAIMFNWATGGKDLIYSLYDALPQNQKFVLDNLYAHADIYFTFQDGVTKNKVKHQMGLVFNELLLLSPELTGEVTLFKDKTVRRLLKQIRIFRSSVNGPMFSVDTVTWMGDPTPDVLMNKFAKTYSTDVAIELVAYVEGNPMFPESVWRPKTESFFEANKQFGQFKKIWIIDLNTKRVEFEVFSE